MTTFFICPAGTGCRFNIEEREITLAPNPANTYFELKNFDPEIDQNMSLSIYDMSGKMIVNNQLASNYVDISSLSSGMFIVRINKSGKEIFQTKLVVNK